MLPRIVPTAAASTARHTAPAEPADDLCKQILGASPAHMHMIDQLRRFAASEAPVLIEGETGSGKELAARAIHYGGPRRARPFVPVNCGALPDTLVETELFGHERGAFTDARHARRGLLAQADGGTLFLDEVDALSPKAQVTLLRFLQDQRYRPVGTPRELQCDVRLVAASNRPLQGLVQQREFRADLMYRLNLLHVLLPPLRERQGDAELLARRFLQALAQKYRCAPKTLHTCTAAWLGTQPWPGNVRELESWVHRQWLMTAGDCIAHDGVDLGGAADVGLRVQAPAPAAALAWQSGSPQTPGQLQGATTHPCALASFQQAKAQALRAFERQYLLQAMQASAGNITHAAQLAGKERRAFGKLLKKHGLACARKVG